MGTDSVVVAAAHCEPGLEGAAKRAEQVRAIMASAGIAAARACVLLGDLNVRQAEVPDLLEAMELRDAHYNGSSWDPRTNKFDERLSGGGVEGQCFDRLWFKGAVWAQAFLVGKCRMFAGGSPFYLSDHFAVFGLVDLHESHASFRARAEREERRVGLGKLREAAVLLERDAVKHLEQSALDRDKAEQMRVAEERLADALRIERTALRAHTKRRYALQRAAYGEETLFAESFDLALAFRGLKPPEPVAPARVCIDVYADLLGVGGARAWECVAGRSPCVGGLLVPGSGSTASWLQVLLRLPAVALWLQAHVGLCKAGAAVVEGAAAGHVCVACAVWAMRKRFGSHTYALEEVRPLMLQREGDPASYVGALLTALRDCEVALGRCGTLLVPEAVTHVDRLFRFWVETRLECVVCGLKGVVSELRWDWRLGVDDADAAGASGAAEERLPSESLADVFLRSCAVKPARVACSSAVCRGHVTEHRQQCRLRTLPNVLLVRVDRSVADGSVARFPMTVDSELPFPRLGANLALAAVVYLVPDRTQGSKYTCACAAADGEFWYYDADFEPCCLGADVAARLPRHGVFCVYQGRGGTAVFEGAVTRVVAQQRQQWRRRDTDGPERGAGAARLSCRLHWPASLSGRSDSHALRRWQWSPTWM